MIQRQSSKMADQTALQYYRRDVSIMEGNFYIAPIVSQSDSTAACSYYSYKNYE